MNTLLFADRLPPLIGGMETHAEYFIKHFDQHDKFPLRHVITKDDNGNDCLIENEGNSIIDIHQLSSTLSFKPRIIFFNSGRWVEFLTPIRKQFPEAIFMYRTGGNEIIKANLGRRMFLSHRERQLYWASQINKNLDCVVTNSLFTESRLRDIGVNPELFLRCVGGVETAYLDGEKSNRLQEVRIFCAARFVPYKNHSKLLLAFSRISEIDSKYRLQLAGDGPLLEESKSLVKSLGLDREVEFLGRLTNEQVLKHLNEVDYYVQLSEERLVMVEGGSFIHAECMGRGLLEAISYGTFIIAADTGAISEIVTENRGVLVDPNDVDHLSTVLEGLILNRKERGQKTDEYSWENYFSKYEVFWESYE
jgi:glycosyltransferase involved in cell wall biosynthesis